jgi:5'-nucleotidase
MALISSWSLVQIQPLVPGVTAYSIEGTPADSVTLALGKLVDGIDLVISGINHGLNLGDDVAISGTVSAARQGYLLGVPAFAISLAAASQPYVDNAARLATLLTKRITADGSSPNVFLNINLPDLPVAEIKGIKITCLASESHTDTVEEGHDGRRKYYWLVRHRLDRDTLEGSDMWAVDLGVISISPLHNHRSTNSLISESLCSDLFQELVPFTTRGIDKVSR